MRTSSAIFTFISLLWMGNLASGAVPTVTTQPQSQDIAAGGSATLTAAFSGAPTGIQWFKDTIALTGQTTASLTLNNLSAADAGDYWCRATNASGTVETGTAALSVLTPGAELEITEFLAKNDDGIRDADASREDWIELHNPGTTSVNLSGWWLTNDTAVPQKWPLPVQSLAPGARLVIFASEKDRRVAGAELHTNFKISTSAGGYLALVRADDSVAQSFTNYPTQFPDISYGRTAQQPALVKSFALPTPDAANVDGTTGAAYPPSFTVPAGVFSGTQTVGITPNALTPSGGTLRYSTDGRLPTFDSPAYTAPLNLSATTNLRSATVFPGERFGATQTAAYIRLDSSAASFTSPLPIVVLHNFGAGAVPGAPGSNDGSNVVDVNRQALSMTILDAASGVTSFSSPVVTTTRAGLRRRGSSSYNFPRKSYSVETWAEFDEQDRNVSLLGMPAESDWVLYAPNPGQQYDDPLIHNSLIYELARQAGYNAPRTRFVEVFLNTGGGDLSSSQNLGLYLLIEKVKRDTNRVDFPLMNADGSAGGWMINCDRMDELPPGSTVGSMAPRHFHTAGANLTLQNPDDSAHATANVDMPEFYHSFFNFESPGGWEINSAQRNAIQTPMRAFDTALYSANYTHPTLGYAPHIDVANWAQFLALNCFAKNQDAVVLSTFLYRASPTAPIRFGPIWDFDRAFASNGTATSSLTWAHDRLYYPRLMTDPEFKQRYIDQWQNLRRSAFTTANMQAVVDAQAAEITSAVAARSNTTATIWNTKITELKTWLADRGTALDALYTQPAVFSQNGGTVPPGTTLTITAPSGSIYYTTNGSDPRAVGGGIAGTAYTGPVTITPPMTVFARVKNGSAWSGTTVATFSQPQDLQTLRVTEIYYNPPGAGVVSGDEFEFLELQNTGPMALDLGGLSFSGITFTFPAGTTLASGTRFLLAKNQTQLASRFPGAVANGIYTGGLSNSGETLALMNGATTVWSFSYDDEGAWPTQPDGGGMSLQRPDPAAIGYDPATWAAAAPSPGIALSLADSDGDGMPDYYETQHGITDANADADGDGATNLAEFNAGTKPLDQTSVFKLAISPSGANQQLAFTAVAARSYTVQASDNLLTGSWQKHADFPAEAATSTKTLNIVVTPPRKFYRVVTPATN